MGSAPATAGASAYKPWNPAAAAASAHAGIPGEVLGLPPLSDAPEAERLRTRIQLVLGEPAIAECVEFLRAEAPLEDRVRVIDFLAGWADPGLMDWLVESVGAPATPKPMALACHRALCAATFFRVALDPDLHYEERRARVARDWAAWWHRNRGRSQSEWLVGRLAGAHELDRLDLIRHLIRVGDVSTVPTLVQYVDTGTLEFRAAALQAISYLTNTVFHDPPRSGPPDPRPKEVLLLDAVVRCQEWWKRARDGTPDRWIRDGFLARGVELHDPPVAADLTALTRALLDPHPAVRSQALRHLIRWTGEVILVEPGRGSDAFERLAEAWRAWIAPRRERLVWDPERQRFGEGPPPAENPEAPDPKSQ